MSSNERRRRSFQDELRSSTTYLNYFPYLNKIPEPIQQDIPMEYIKLKEEDWPSHCYDFPIKIDEHIWVSGIAFASDVPLWCENNSFTHILNAAGQYARDDFYKTHPMDLNIEYLELEMFDESDFKLLPFLDSVYQFLYDAYRDNNKILVHCMWGQSRSVCCIIYFFMMYYWINFEVAFRAVKHNRITAYPNEGFINELRKIDQVRFGIEPETIPLDPYVHNYLYNKLITQVLDE